MCVQVRAKIRKKAIKCALWKLRLAEILSLPDSPPSFSSDLKNAFGELVKGECSYNTISDLEIGPYGLKKFKTLDLIIYAYHKNNTRLK